MPEIDAILRENIRIMAQVITEVCQRDTRKKVCDPPLSRNQYYLLNILATSGEFLISDLARILDISPAATSKNIDRLEQLELVFDGITPGGISTSVCEGDQHRAHEFCDLHMASMVRKSIPLFHFESET